MRTTIMEINLDNFKYNINNIKKHIGNKKIIPVIKANAYGTYINKRIDIINEFDIVAVALSEEGVELRSLGYQKDILILNQPAIEELDDILENDLTIGLSDISFINYLVAKNISIKAHLEIETGMNRTGIKLEDLSSYLRLLDNSKIIIDGIYTHLSSADEDYEYTKRQLELFATAVEVIKKKYPNISYIHSSASNGLVNFNDTVSNAIRPGIIMYGYYSSASIINKINLKPITILKTKITFLKDIQAGESVGYNRKYIAKNNMKIATVSIGYADGLKRTLSNNGKMIVNNKIVNIIGNICMDSCMLDVTNVSNVKVGDIVYVWDNKLVTVEDIAILSNTINYEIISTISPRVPRVFL